MPCDQADPLFEGCTDCGVNNKFDGAPMPPNSCLECDKDYFKVDWRNGETRCVRHDMYWDCNPQPAIDATATTPARDALPQGPDNCDMCYMVGHDMACGHCKPGFMVEPMTRECVPDQPANGPNSP